jgi:hypothetical protein
MKCSFCAREIPKGSTQCPLCKQLARSDALKGGGRFGATISLADVAGDNYERLSTGPWDYALWGNAVAGEERPKVFGAVWGSVILMGGEPGSGKSTLSLQWAAAAAATFTNDDYVLYIASEEGASMLKGRASRLGLKDLSRIRVEKAILGADRPPTVILEDMIAKPRLIVVDSTKVWTPILEEETAKLKKYADPSEGSKEPKSIVILVHQLNKALDFVGEMAFQHAVDVTLGVTGRDDGTQTREITAIKNRFGRTLWPIVFDMTDKGLVFLGINEDMQGPATKKGKKGKKEDDTTSFLKTVKDLKNSEDSKEEESSDDSDEEFESYIIPTGTIPPSKRFFEVNPPDEDIEIDTSDGVSSVEPNELYSSIEEAFAEYQKKSDSENRETLLGLLSIGGFTWD